MTRQNGFTLLELLVGLAIFGLVMAGLSAGTHYVVRAGDMQAHLIDRTSGLDAIQRALRRAFAEAMPGSPDRVALTGAPDQVAWTTTLPQAMGPERERIDTVLLVDTDHRLVMC